MAIRFDHNNNSEEWQVFFEKINNGSPFGVIKEVFFYDHSPNNPNNSPKLKQFLEHKREFIGFVETFIKPNEILFFIYENEPSVTFNLKNYLLVLATTHCNPTAICYCGNKHDTQNTDTKEIKLLNAKMRGFGEELNSINVELSNPNIFIQSPINLVVTPALAPWKTTVEIEEHKKIQHLIKIIIRTTIGKALHKTLKSMKLLMT
ncbi:hypothetical protein HPHPP41_0979 [Helicobacter pylori Hp P-41]|nr:hypothetical protein HPHPP41_0979 [Helicobacter pylori Hp P-41]